MHRLRQAAKLAVINFVVLSAAMFWIERWVHALTLLE